MTFDHAGNLHVTRTDTSMCFFYNAEGKEISKLDNVGSHPSAVSIALDGRVFVYDRGDLRVRTVAFRSALHLDHDA